MEKRLKFFGIIAALAIIGFSTTGCASTSAFRERSLSDQMISPSKDFVVIGAVVVRNTTERTVIADLKEAAIAMGGHDIINVRVTETNASFLGIRLTHTIDSATAVVIMYTDETLRDDWNTVVISDGNIAYTSTGTTLILEDTGGSGLFGGGGGDRGFIGNLLSRIPLLGRLF